MKSRDLLRTTWRRKSRLREPDTCRKTQSERPSHPCKNTESKTRTKPSQILTRSEWTESERRKRTSPGGITSFCRRWSCSHNRPENILPCIHRRRCFQKQWRPQLPSPYQIPAFTDCSDRFDRDEAATGVAVALSQWPTHVSDGGGMWKDAWLHGWTSIERERERERNVILVPRVSS